VLVRYARTPRIVRGRRLKLDCCPVHVGPEVERSKFFSPAVRSSSAPGATHGLLSLLLDSPAVLGACTSSPPPGPLPRNNSHSGGKRGISKRDEAPRHRLSVDKLAAKSFDQLDAGVQYPGSICSVHS